MTPNSIRIATVMQLRPGQAREYQRRHDELWPELERALKAHGAEHYSIFLHPETEQLFACLNVRSEEKWQAIADTDICQKWWRYMADIMDTNEDNSPRSVPLQSVFYLA
ncbi:L-rhamnose mutarotase [Vibrio scophthalmi]|uniref:L-rhamnose mutarotase n=1 Tax=Vibrio scophthalmi TaxID=45658 RepID=UPI002FF186B5